MEEKHSKERDFPEEVRKELGYMIFKLQLDDKLVMPFKKSMPSLGKGCQVWHYFIQIVCEFHLQSL